jgi:site-specific recombinase XerD
MIEDMTLRNLSTATQQSYVYAVANFSRYFGTSPDQLGMEAVRAYQLHLISQRKSRSHINQVACALRFFYAVTLDQAEAFDRITSGRDPEKLPLVLDKDEVARFLEAVVGFRNRVALTTAYAAGLCKIASNSDPLKGSFRGQFRPPSDACQCRFLLSFDRLLEGLAGGDWRGPYWPNSAGVF